ncbi:MAG TPA: NAD(+)/NADH kinase [Polyangiaceae bacterium]|nr:NAD(+)/NADH kinase [Polyangiaceae bacterium]
MSRPHVVVVSKRTAYSRYVEDERDPRVVELLRRRDPAVHGWQKSHREHSRTLDEVERVLSRQGVRVLLVQRAQAVFDVEDAALVVVVGGDGTLLAASHSVGASGAILGVNSAPEYSVGFFCAARRETFRGKVAAALEGKLESVTLTRMAVEVNGRRRSSRVLNEALFCHSSPAATSRYELHRGKVREEQRSSGFWIGPAAGSTAALRSAGGKVLPLGSRALQLVVREPYVMFGRSYKLLKVLIEDGQQLVAESKMDEAALFLDGPYRQLPVQLGDEVSFRASDEPLKLLGLRSRMKR